MEISVEYDLNNMNFQRLPAAAEKRNDWGDFGDLMVRIPYSRLRADLQNDGTAFCRRPFSYLRLIPLNI